MKNKKKVLVSAGDTAPHFFPQTEVFMGLGHFANAFSSDFFQLYGAEWRYE